MAAIFLDRDGVIIQKAPQGEYVADWSEVRFLPGSLEAIAAFRRCGYQVFIVTNQRGLATGKIHPSNLEEIHSRMNDAILSHGGEVSAIYVCPHDVPEECSCRKPKPGMLLKAAQEHGLYLPDCWMVGDSASDIEAGIRAGCKTALISPSGSLSEGRRNIPDILVRSLSQTARHILGSDTNEGQGRG